MTEEQEKKILENIAARRAREDRLRASRDVRWTSRKEGEKKSRNAVKGTLASIGVGAKEGVKSTAANAKAFVKTDLGTGKAQGLKTAEKAVSEGADYDGFMKQMRQKYGKVQTFWPMKMSQEDRDMYASVLQKKKLGLGDKQSLAQAQAEQQAKQSSIDAERLVRSIKSKKALQAVDDKYELGKVGEFAQEAGGALGQMLPSLGVGLINPAAGLAAFGAQAAAQGYGQALDEGATHEQATRYGVGTGLMEAGIERATGGLSRFYGKGFLDKAMRMAPNDSVKNVLLNAVKGAAGEGAEEAVSAIADPYLQRATYNPAAENASFGDVAHQAAIGAALGGILGGGSNALGYRAQKKAAEREQAGAQGAQGERVTIDTSQRNEGLNGDLESRRTAVDGRNFTADSNGTQDKAVKVGKAADEGSHIDKRDYKSVGSRKINAFSYDNPEVRPYYVTEAKRMRQELSEAQKPGKYFGVSEHGLKDTDAFVGGHGRIASQDIVTARDEIGLSYKEIDKALDDIIEDSGRENNANAKKLEVLFDQNLSMGMETGGYRIPPNAEYIRTKEGIAGAADYGYKAEQARYENGEFDPINDNPYAFEATVYAIAKRRGHELTKAEAEEAEALQEVIDADRTAFTEEEIRQMIDEQVSKWKMPQKEAQTPYEQAFDEMLKGEDSTKPKAESEDERRVKEFIQSAAVRARMQVKYVDRPLEQKAYYKDGVIYINKNRPLDEGVKVTVAHELYHALEGTKEHEAIIEMAIKAQGNNAQKLIVDKINDYASHGVELDETGARAEIGAEFIEKAMTDEATVNQVLLEDRTLAAKILERIKEIIAVYKAKKEKNMSAAEAREYAALLKARRLYEDGLEKLHRDEYSPAGTERARYQAIKRTDDGRNYVEIEEDILQGVPKSQWGKVAMQNLAKKFPNGVQIGNNLIKINAISRNELQNSRYTQQIRKDNSTDIYRDKMAATNNADELLQSNRDYVNEEVKHERKDNIKQFGRGEILFKVGQNTYAADMVVGNKADGSMVMYDIVNIRPENFNKKRSSASESYSLSDADVTASTNNIPNFNENVNSKSKNFEERYALDEQGGINGERYNELIDRYGRIEPGMEPRVDVAVPKQVNDWDKTRRFVRTAMESENISAEAKDKIADSLASDIANGRFVYEPMSNKKLQEEVNANIAKVGYEKSKAEVFAKYQKNERIKAEDVATLEQLIVKANAEGKVDDVMDMAGLVSMIATEMGQSVQALSMMKRMSPEGRLRQMVLLRDRLNSKYELTGEKQVELNPRYTEMMLDKNNSSGNMETVQSYIIDDMAKQLPVGMKDKFDAWRYLAMLGNPRTHIRNIVGNILNLSLSRINDQLAGVVESVAIKNGTRTKSAGAVSKELKEFAKADWENNGRKRTDLSNKYGERGQAERNRKIFTSKVMQPAEKARKLNERAMDWEDTIFKKAQYIYALSHYMKANGISVETMRNESSQVAERARQYAEQEAYRVTFQEANEFANMLNRLEHKKTDKKSVKALQLGTKALMPFKKTPLNILNRGVEYSPVGLLNGIGDMFTKVRKGKMNATEAINEITQGLTGTGIVALGYFLAEAGLLTAGYDEGNKREQNYENQIGGQNYAITLPGGGTYTLDWAAPAAMPLFVGAALCDEILSREEGENVGLRDIGHALIKITDPVLEMSCMDSLQSALESYGNEGLTSNMITSAVTSYVMQFVPTLSGQIARTVDETKRSTYAPKDSKYTKTGESLGRQFANKVPGLSYRSEAAVDVWGRERKQAGGNAAGRAFNNTLSPGTYSSNKETATDKELKRLYESSGESGVLPKMGSKYISYKADGKKSKTYYLTSKEYTKYQTKYGQDNFQAVSELMRSNMYRSMSDEDKAAAVKEIYTYNAQMANKEFFKGRNVSYDAGASTTEKLKDAGGWANYFAIKEAFPDSNYDVAKKRKDKCDKYGIDYTAYAESNAKIAELRSANSERYTKASDKTEANKRAIAQYLAGRKDLTNPQRQVIWQEYYKGKTSETYISVARRYGF